MCESATKASVKSGVDAAMSYRSVESTTTTSYVPGASSRTNAAPSPTMCVKRSAGAAKHGSAISARYRRDTTVTASSMSTSVRCATESCSSARPHTPPSPPPTMSMRCVAPAVFTMLSGTCDSISWYTYSSAIVSIRSLSIVRMRPNSSPACVWEEGGGVSASASERRSAVAEE